MDQKVQYSNTILFLILLLFLSYYYANCVHIKLDWRVYNKVASKGMQQAPEASSGVSIDTPRILEISKSEFQFQTVLQ